MVKIFKNFKEVHTLRPGFSAEGIYGGALLAVRSNDFICFYDWNTYQVPFPPSLPALSFLHAIGLSVAFKSYRTWFCRRIG